MKRIALTLLLVALLNVPLFFAQAQPSSRLPNGDQILEMTTIGNGEQFGRSAAFRTYETPDHTGALVWYGSFQSEQESKRRIKQCLRQHKITNTENIKGPNGEVIGDRIEAASKETHKAFMVIQRQGLHYWIIQSISPAVALQVAGLIEPPSPEKK